MLYLCRACHADKCRHRRQVNSDDRADAPELLSGLVTRAIGDANYRNVYIDEIRRPALSLSHAVLERRSGAGGDRRERDGGCLPPSKCAASATATRINYAAIAGCRNATGAADESGRRH